MFINRGNTQLIIIFAMIIAIQFLFGGCISNKPPVCTHEFANIAIDANYVLDKRSGKGIIIFSTGPCKLRGDLYFKPDGIPNFKSLLPWNQGYYNDMPETSIDVLIDNFKEPIYGKSHIYLNERSGDFNDINSAELLSLRSDPQFSEFSRYYAMQGINLTNMEYGGLLHVIVLPAGEYIFYRYYNQFTRPPLNYTINTPLLWKFNVSPGEAKYLGYIKITVTEKKFVPKDSIDQFYISMGAKDISGFLNVIDMSSRDLPIFEKKYPNIHVSEIKVDIIKTEQLRQGILP
jgi:hypothetical protein